jgi:hypothetical protein
MAGLPAGLATEGAGGRRPGPSGVLESLRSIKYVWEVEAVGVGWGISTERDSGYRVDF